MKKAILAGLVLSAALFAAVVTSGVSSAHVGDKPYAQNSAVGRGSGQEVCSQGT